MAISKDLVTEVLDYFETHSRKNEVVKPSLPILYFGDEKAYSESSLKVVTVGKNPSNNEFPISEGKHSFERFSNWNDEERNLLQALNSYFEDNPYTSWFNCYEPMLNGMNASYYKKTGHKNIAIHTDICSPLATDPTWSALPQEVKTELFEKGFCIWKKLIEELQPDIMLASIPRDLIKLLGVTFKNELHRFTENVEGEPRVNDYVIEIYQYELKSKKKVNIIFGQPAITPFQLIGNIQKQEVGAKALEELCQK